jgi:hypothetical protein
MKLGNLQMKNTMKLMLPLALLTLTGWSAGDWLPADWSMCHRRATFHGRLTASGTGPAHAPQARLVQLSKGRNNVWSKEKRGTSHY